MSKEVMQSIAAAFNGVMYFKLSRLEHKIYNILWDCGYIETDGSGYCRATKK